MIDYRFAVVLEPGISNLKRCAGYGCPGGGGPSDAERPFLLLKLHTLGLSGFELVVETGLSPLSRSQSELSDLHAFWVD